MNILSILELADKYKDTDPDKVLLSKHIGDKPEIRRAVATQIRIQPIIKKKLPTWHKAPIYIPSTLNLEQASSEQTALSKQKYVRQDDVLLDLTGGLGVDFWAMASMAKYSIYVEENSELFEASSHNLAQLLPSESYTMYQADATTILQDLLQRHKPTIIYLDPARRASSDGAHRVYAIEDCTPSLYEIIHVVAESSLEHKPRIVAKLSPMLDINYCLKNVPHITSIEVVAYHNEVKELLLNIDLSSPKHSDDDYLSVPLCATNIDNKLSSTSFTSNLKEEQATQSQFTDKLGQYLYEPNGAILKLGLFNQIGLRFKLRKLHTHSHLYSSDELLNTFSGRCLRIKEVIPYHSREIKQLHKRINGAQISCRNFPLSSEALRKKLKIKEQHEQTLFATTLHDGSLVLLYCEKV